MATRQSILDLQTRLRNAISAMAELKRNPQAMSGDSWVFYRRIPLSTEWDIEAHGITSPSFEKLYKVTYEVDRPETGVAFFFFDFEFDTLAQNMSYTYEPIGDDPYSYYVIIKHVDYNSTSAGISVRANVFSPQRGTITVTEIV